MLRSGVGLRWRFCLSEIRCQRRSTSWRSLHQNRVSHEAFGASKRPPPFANFSESVGRPAILRPTLFVISVSTISYLVAAKLTNRDTNYWTDKLSSSPTWRWAAGGVSGTSSGEMKRARLFTFVDVVKRQLEDIKRATLGFPNAIRYAIVHSYAQTMQTWVNSHEGARLCYKIIALNGLVWLGWQLSRTRPLMIRYFLHNPLSGATFGLLGSMFSHQSFIHLAFNMLALMSFGNTTFMWMENSQSQSESRLQESTAQYHFTTFFMSAGLFSNLLSHIVSARVRFPRALKELSRNAPTQERTALGHLQNPIISKDSIQNIVKPSLGASGAIYATVVVTAMSFPDTQISLIFPPTPPIPIQYGMGGMVCLDILGILRGWRVFDHWAHLGGAAFGALYWKYGAYCWDRARVATQ